MKKQFNRINVNNTLILSLLLSATLLSACKKTEQVVAPADKTETPIPPYLVSNDKLVKFLSITLGVDKEEVILDEKNNEFSVRGLKFNRTETETRYLGANVYKATYGE